MRSSWRLGEKSVMDRGCEVWVEWGVRTYRTIWRSLLSDGWYGTRDILCLYLSLTRCAHWESKVDVCPNKLFWL